MVSGGWRFKALRTLAFAAVLAAAAACGGGGGGGASAPPALSEAELAEVRADPRVARIGDILGRADALLMTSAHARYSLAGGGLSLDERLVDAVDCTGASCTASDGTAISVGALTDPAGLEVRLAGADLGGRGGFDTAATRGSFEITERAPGVTLTAAPTAYTYGFWGEHGYAALELGAGPIAGQMSGAAATGEFAFARAYAAGDASGTNPSGAGSATWSGIVEASRTASFARLQGTVTLTIDDLARPRVGVSVDVPGHAIGAPGWASIPLTQGRFTTGTAGTDYLGGHFHGPGHEEAWGVFDITGYIGAFGAKRAP